MYGPIQTNVYTIYNNICVIQKMFRTIEKCSISIMFMSFKKCVCDIFKHKCVYNVKKKCARCKKLCLTFNRIYLACF